jgi:hypothetical protein
MFSPAAGAAKEASALLAGDTRNFPGGVVSEFGRLIGERGLSHLRGIIRSLRGAQADRAYFENIMWGLPKASIDKRGNPYTPMLTLHDGRKTQEIHLRKIGGGSYGTIYTDQTGVAYKEVTYGRQEADGSWTEGNHISYEEFCREFFLEALVQVLLHNDPDMGNRVGKLEGIYADNRIRRGTAPHLGLTFFFRMERIPYTLESYVAQHGDSPTFCSRLGNVFSGKRGVTNLLSACGNKYMSLKQGVEKFTQLGQTLAHFALRYGFKHRDLHQANVMFDAHGNIKIIDFGMACLDFGGGDVYAVSDPACVSCDLLIYMSSIYENDSKREEIRLPPLFSDELYDWIHNTMNHKGVNVYDFFIDDDLKKSRATGNPPSPVFHHFYSFSDLYTLLQNDSLPPILCDPAQFVAFIKSQGGGGRHTRRQSQNSKQKHSRRNKKPKQKRRQ